MQHMQRKVRAGGANKAAPLGFRARRICDFGSRTLEGKHLRFSHASVDAKYLEFAAPKFLLA